MKFRVLSTLFVFIFLVVLPLASGEPSKNNDYSLDVANLIREKCDGCKHTLILGDDFVVPHFRRDIDMSTWFGFGSDTDETYSDVGYVGRTIIPFSNFEEIFYQKGNYNGKNVLVVLPNNVDVTMRSEIDKLENFLRSSPEIKATITEENSYSASECNSAQMFSLHDGYTLIIIGTEDTNKAFKCFPFVLNNNMHSVTIERNPWDNRAYAVVVYGDVLDLAFLNNQLATGNYKQLRSEGWLIARDAALVGAIGLGFVTGGAGFAVEGAAFTLITSVVANSAVPAAECVIYNDQGNCVEAAVGAAFGVGGYVGGVLLQKAFASFGASMKPLYATLGDDAAGSLLANAERKGLMEVEGVGWRAISSKYSTQTIKNTLNTAARTEEANIGASVFLRNSVNVLDDIPFAETESIEFLQSVGKADSGFRLGINTPKIKFASPTSTHFADGGEARLVGDTIFIKNTVNNQKLTENVLNHEFGHKFVNQKLGREIWEFVDDGLAGTEGFKKRYIHEFNEFLAEYSSKVKVDGHILEYISENWRVYDEIVNSILNRQPDRAAKILAQSQLNDPFKHSLIVNNLRTAGYTRVNDIIELSEYYVNYAQSFVSTGRLSNTQIEEVASLTKDLLQ